jgi:hypothetical protein
MTINVTTDRNYFISPDITDALNRESDETYSITEFGQVNGRPCKEESIPGMPLTDGRVKAISCQILAAPDSAGLVGGAISMRAGGSWIFVAPSLAAIRTVEDHTLRGVFGEGFPDLKLLADLKRCENAFTPVGLQHTSEGVPTVCLAETTVLRKEPIHNADLGQFCREIEALQTVLQLNIEQGNIGQL